MDLSKAKLDYLEPEDPIKDAALTNIRVATELGVNPDSVAKSRQLAGTLGLPEAVVADNPEAARAKAWTQAADSWLVDAPKTSTLLSDPQNAKVAHDDVEALRNIEMLRRKAEETPWFSKEREEAVREYGRAMKDNWGITRAYNAMDYQLEKVAPLAKRQLHNVLSTGVEDEALDVELFRAKALAPEAPQPENLFETAAYSAAELLPIIFQFMGAYATGGVAGGVGAGLTVAPGFFTPATAPAAIGTALAGAGVGAKIAGAKSAFDLESSLFFSDISDVRDENGEPLDPMIKAGGAIIYGAGVSILDLTGFSALAKILPGGSKITKEVLAPLLKEGLKDKAVQAALRDVAMRYAKGVSVETLTELGQEALSIFTEIAAKGVSESMDGTYFAPTDWAAQAERMKDVGVKTLLGTALLGVVPAGASAVVEGRNAARVQTWRDQQVELHAAIQSSQTMQRSPETMRAFGDILGLGEEAWIDAEALAQRGPELMQRIGVDQEVVAQAAQDGVMIRLDTSRLMYEAEYPDLLQDLRPAPSAMSAREAESYDPVQALRDIEEAAIDAETVVAEVVAVKDRMRQTLEARGLGETLDANWELALRLSRMSSPKGDPTAFVQKLNFSADVVERWAGSQVDQQTPGRERQAGDFTVNTEDAGVISARVIRSENGDVSIFTDKSTTTYNAEFAGGKTDEEIISYAFEPLGVIGVSATPTADQQALQQDAAYAGVENEAEVEEAGRLWAEMGTESPYFKRWSGGAPVVQNADASSNEVDSGQLAEDKFLVDRYTKDIATEKGYWETAFPREKAWLEKNIKDLQNPTAEEIELAMDMGIIPPGPSGFEGMKELSDQRVREMEQKVAEAQSRIDAASAKQEKFQTGKPIVVRVFHTTPMGELIGGAFDAGRLGANTKAGSATLGHFFAGSERTAEAYGSEDAINQRGFISLSPDQKAELVRALDEEVRSLAEEVEDFQPVTAGEFAAQNPSYVRDLAGDLFGVDYDSTPTETKTYEVFVNLKNPYVYDFKGERYREQSYFDIMQKAQAEGHDGVILLNTYDGGPKDNIFAIFKGNEAQIKSTGNRGTFDPADARILYQIAEPVRAYAEANTGWSQNSAQVWTMLQRLSDFDAKMSALVSEQRATAEELDAIFAQDPKKRDAWEKGVKAAAKELKAKLVPFNKDGSVNDAAVAVLFDRKAELKGATKKAIGSFVAGHGRYNAFEINKVLRANENLKAEILQMQDEINALFGLTPILDKNGIVTLGIERRKAKYSTGVENDYKPQFGGFARSFAQTFMDYLPDQVFETFRSELTKAVEHAYQNGGNGIPGVTFMDKALDNVSKSDFRVAGPVKKAEKTVGALNLNSACPMFMIGSHGCYFDGCYVTGMGMGGNTITFYNRAAYTGELLQLSQEDVDLLNSVGGLRLNGQGDLTDRQFGQLRDIVKHAKMRGLKLKVITKQDDTLRMLQRIADEGGDISGIQVQTSIDPYWINVSEDELVDSFAQNMEINKALEANPDNETLMKMVIDLYAQQGREAKIIDGKVYRKYGYSVEKAMEAKKLYPDINFQYRVVVGTPEEVVYYARKHPEILQTWMHASIRQGMYSDVAGRMLKEGEIGNFTARIAVVQDENGVWRIRAQERSENEPGGDVVFGMTKDIAKARRAIETADKNIAAEKEKISGLRADIKDFQFKGKKTASLETRLSKAQEKLKKLQDGKAKAETELADTFKERDRVINRRAKDIPLAIRETYSRVEQHLAAQPDADKLFRVLAGSLEGDPSALCCAAGADKDACNNCVSHCHRGAPAWNQKPAAIGDLRPVAEKTLTMQEKLAQKLAQIEAQRTGITLNQGLDAPVKPGMLGEKEVVYARAEQGDGGPISPGGGEGALSEERGLRSLPGARLVELQTAEKRSAPAAVSSPRQAAAAMAFLSDAPQEQVAALVLDAKGRPLAILSHSLGTMDSSQIDYKALLGAIQDIEGAASFYLAHNHPAENAVLSGADRTLSENVRSINEGSGISYGGLFAVTPDQYADEYAGGLSYPAAGKQKKISVVQRMFSKVERVEGLGPISSPEDIKKNLDEITGGINSGVVLLNNRNVPVGFLPMAPSEMAVLRGDRLGEVLKSIHRTNATGLVGILPNESALPDWRNVAAMANAIYARPLDALYVGDSGKLESARMQGKDVDAWKNTTFYQQQQTGPRGAYNQLKDGSHLVRLFEQANASTMPHELAHAFLTELRAMAETGVADEAMLNDLQKIEAWLDREAVEGSPEWQSYYEDGLAQGMNEAQARERATFILRHEKFSRGFEQYLWEGKAPEPELEGVFARFSRWLKQIYQDALAFGVNLDPEIRSVFDRMLKADAEVESKVMELGFTPMTQALAKHLGLGPEDRDYAVRLYSAALEKAEAKLAQARNKGLRKLRAEWKKDAIEEAKQSREHQLVLSLRSGRGLSREDYLLRYAPWNSPEADGILAGLASVDEEMAFLEDMRAADLDNYKRVVQRIRALGGIDYESSRQHLGAAGIQNLQSKYGIGIVSGAGQPLDILVDMLSEEVPELAFDREIQNLVDWLESSGKSRKQIEAEYKEKRDSLKAERDYGSAMLEEAQGPARANARAALEELPGGVAKKNGMMVSEAAFEYGYDSEAGLVEALWNYRKPEDIAAEVVEAKTAERDATFKVEDFILETAEFAAYQELMAKAYDKDGNVLSNKAFRDYARKIVATMPLADAMDVRGFLAAMARHHKAETKALKAGKLADAAKANKKARLNHAYAQEALNVRKRVEKAERMAKRLTKLKAGQIEEGHHKALLQLIQRFGLTKKDFSGLQDVPALADLVKLQDAFGADEEASFSQWLLSGEARNYKDLTSGEFEELQDLMKFLYGTGKDMIWPTLKVSGLDMQDVRDQIVPQIEALPKRGKRRKEGTWLRKIQDQVQSYLSQNRMPLWIIRELDGYTALKGVVGPLEKWLYEPLEAANLKRAELSRQLEKRTRKARAQLLKSATAKANKVSLVNLPVPPAWQRQGRVWDFDACLSVLMNMGNAVNRQRVMDGYNLTEQDLQQILAVFSQKDAQAVQDIWDAMDEILWPEIAGAHKKLRFFTPGKVEAEAFTMPDGTVLRGGYYPLKYDPSADTRAARNQDLDKAVQNPSTAMLPKSVASGATKARAQSAGGMPVLLRTSVLSGHLDWAVHYASHALVIHDLGRILGDKEIAEAIKTAAGEETFRAANELVKRIANPRAGDLPTFLDKVFGKLTGISAVYSMWMNRFGPLTQPTAIGNYIAAEGGWGKGTATWMKGAAHFLANPAKQWNWLMENNPALQNHFTLIRQQLSQAIGEDFRDIQLGKTKSGRIWTATKETVIRGGIAMYGVMDAVVSVPGWYGSYLRGLDENLSPEDAIIRANKIMAEYTPMSRDMDKTLFQHTKGMARAWTYMMSYFTKQANTNAGYWKAWRQGAIKTDQFIGQIVAVQILPAVVVSMMYSLLTGDDDDRDNILLDAGLEVAAYPFAGLPFAREGAAWAANLARAGITGDTKKLGRNAFQMPGMMYLQLMQRAGSTTYAMVQDFDDDEKQAKALMSLAELTAASAGLPPVPKIAKEVMRGLDDIDDDEGNILNVLIKPKIRKRD